MSIRIAWISAAFAVSCVAAGCGGSNEKAAASGSSTTSGTSATPATPATAVGSTASTPAATPPGAAGSYADVLVRVGARERDEDRRQKRDRRDAIAAYVATHAGAADAERASRAVIDLSSSLEDWDSVVKQADAFLAAFPASKSRTQALSSKAEALAGLGRTEDAKAAWKSLAESLDLSKDGVYPVWNAWSSYAGLLADAGDVDGAKVAYAAIPAKYPAKGEKGEKEKSPHAQLKGLADSAVEALASIGTAPKPFPASTKDMDGKPLSLAAYAGKVVMVDFWATWCGPCRAELPDVVAAYERWHDKGFEIVGVSLDQKDKADDVRDFLAAYGMPWPQFYDGGWWKNELAVHYAVHSIPHTLLLGKDGKIARMDLRGASLDRALEKLLGSSATPATPK